MRHAAEKRTPADGWTPWAGDMKRVEQLIAERSVSL